MEANCDYRKNYDDINCCVPDRCRISEPSTQITKFIGCNNLGEINGISFVRSSLKYLPHGLANLFKNIHYLNFDNCNVMAISKEDLKELPHLKSLQVADNHLTSLPGNLFIYSRNLEEISFYGNRIATIGRNLLEPLEKLEIADFRNNFTISLCHAHDDSSFRSNCTLEELKDHIKTICVFEFESDKASVMNDIEKLLSTETLKDFKVVIDETEFRVHKIVIAARSET